jgi:cell division protein FtsI/penicillin-binding protein 2
VFDLAPPTTGATPPAAKAKAADELAANLDETDDVELDAPDAVTGRREIKWAKLAENVSEATDAAIEKLGIKGVYGNRVFRRTYPHRELASQLIGFVNATQQPVTGIERYADFYLRGQDGWREGERDGRANELAQFRTRDVPRADGYSLSLTINANVQDIVQQELAAIVHQYQPIKATIIVSDPTNGFILGLGNYPTFDPNEYNKVPKDQIARMKNIAATDIYEPGSVFKIVAASGALEEGLATPATQFDCSIEKIDYLGKTRPLPREDHHFGRLTVAEIIAHSSNRGAAQLAMRLGEQRFYDYARAFGFGQVTGLPGGHEEAGIMAPPAKWDGITITRMPMGQSVAVTALQMHQAMAVIASGGSLLRPQLISQISDASGEAVYRFGRTEVRRVVSPRTAQTMAQLLMGVASKEGTAPEAAIAGYEVAGKTATAQKYIEGKPSTTHHVASFIGFFPASRPRSGNLRDCRRCRCPLPGRRGLRRQGRGPLVQASRGAAHSAPRHQGWPHQLDQRPAGHGRKTMIGYLALNDPLIHALQARPAIRRSPRARLDSARLAPAAPRLADHFADGDVIAIKGELDRPISGLAIDSRRVVPGAVFFALSDLTADGATSMDEAVSRGAVAVVAERMPTIPPARVTFIRVADIHVALARVAQRFYEFPDRDLNSIGVTGRAGKTTVAHLIRRFLGGSSPVGLLGSVHYDLGSRVVPSNGTTPLAVDVFGLMAQMRDAGCRESVIEVSSQGIAEKRVLGLHLGVAVFTNLAVDPLAGNGSSETEFEVMTRLFSGKNGTTPKWRSSIPTTRLARGSCASWGPTGPMCGR